MPIFSSGMISNQVKPTKAHSSSSQERLPITSSLSILMRSHQRLPSSSSSSHLDPYHVEVGRLLVPHILSYASWSTLEQLEGKIGRTIRCWKPTGATNSNFVRLGMKWTEDAPAPKFCVRVQITFNHGPFLGDTSLVFQLNTWECSRRSRSCILIGTTKVATRLLVTQWIFGLPVANL